MERDSFIFYRSFYEATKELAKDIRLEVLTAIIEYGLFGKEPEGLKPFAKGMFTLVKPNLDVNTERYKNAKKGGRKPRKAADIPVTESPAVKSLETPDYSSYEEEIQQIKDDQIWSEAVCMKFNIDKSEFDKRLEAFLLHCKVERSNELHPSINDAKRHFTSWMKKAYKNKNSKEQSKPDDYTYNGGFGGVDS